jgi:hypothetical protein
MRHRALRLAVLGGLIVSAGLVGCASAPSEAPPQEPASPSIRGKVYNLDCQQRCQVLLDSDGTTTTTFVEDERLLRLLEGAFLSGKTALIELGEDPATQDPIVRRVGIALAPGKPPRQGSFGELYDVAGLQLDAPTKTWTATFRSRSGDPELSGTTSSPLMVTFLSCALGAGLALDYVTIDPATKSITRARLATDVYGS